MKLHKTCRAQALNNAMQALKDSIQDHAQVEASSKFINEDPTQKVLILMQLTML